MTKNPKIKAIEEEVRAAGQPLGDPTPRPPPPLLVVHEN